MNDTLRFSIAVVYLIGAPLLAADSIGKTKKPPEHPSKLSYEPLDWKIPLGSPHRTVLANGLRAYVAVDSSMPIITVTGYVRSGTINDPPGKEGLARIAVNLMQTAGTARYKPDTLDAIVELYAIRIAFAARETEIEFRFSFLSEYADTSLSIMQQILFQPAFDPAKIAKQKSIFTEEIRHRFDNPGPILDAAYDKAMYSGQRVARLPTEKSVAAITREDLRKFHATVFKTVNCIAAVSGNFDRDSLIRRIGQIFPASNGMQDSFLVNAPVSPAIPCLVVHKEITQAYVRLGLPLFKRPHPDYYAVSVLNMILGGGGFTSRLATKIRSDEGLTYSIHSDAESNYIFPATFSITFNTATQSAARATGLCIKEVEKMLQDGITAEELSNAKKALIDGLPSMFRSPNDIVKTYAWNEYYERPDSQYAKYPAEINAITQEEVLRAAKKYLAPSAFTYVFVGDTSQLLHQTAEGFSLAGLQPKKVIKANEIAQLP